MSHSLNNPGPFPRAGKYAPMLLDGDLCHRKSPKDNILEAAELESQRKPSSNPGSTIN